MDVPSLPVVLASLSLVGITLGLATWLRLTISREVLIAALRAAIQLLAVGAIFTWIFDNSAANALAWAWVAVMVTIATYVTRRRAQDHIERLVPLVGATVAGSTLIAIGVTFGLGVIEFTPVALAVIAGITIGNAVPSAVLGVNRAMAAGRDRGGEIEAVLALGFTRRQVQRFIAPEVARTALIPQVERTKVVGLIALPGAMTGLLLAGVGPVEAVVIQLLVMYLVLGTATLCVVTIVATITIATTTPDLRLAEWAGSRSETGT